MRYWTCRKCAHRNQRTASRRCEGCGEQTKPKPRRPAHAVALEMTYQQYLELQQDVHGLGEVCGICERPPATRRLDRDHSHTTGKPRGLLCARCNQRLERGGDTLEWLSAAMRYIGRAELHHKHEAA